MNIRHSSIIIFAVYAAASIFIACSEGGGVLEPVGPPGDYFPFGSEYHWKYRCTVEHDSGTVIKNYEMKIDAQPIRGGTAGVLMVREVGSTGDWRESWPLLDSAGVVYMRNPYDGHLIVMFHHMYDDAIRPPDTVVSNGTTYHAYPQLHTVKLHNAVSIITHWMAPGYGIVKETGTAGGSFFIQDFAGEANAKVTSELTAFWKSD